MVQIFESTKDFPVAQPWHDSAKIAGTSSTGLTGTSSAKLTGTSSTGLTGTSSTGLTGTSSAGLTGTRQGEHREFSTGNSALRIQSTK